MLRKEGKLKPFLTERVKNSNFINLNCILHQGIHCMCLEFPRYRKSDSNFNANEAIFKEWEEIHKREYKSYAQKYVLKQAIKKSRFYEVLSYENKKFIFRERSPEELVKAKKNAKVKKIESSKSMNPASPESSGYETGSPSYIQVATPLKEVFSPPCTLSPQITISSIEEWKAECAVQPVEKFTDQSMDTSNLFESGELILFSMLDDMEVSRNSTEENTGEAAEEITELCQSIHSSDLLKDNECDKSSSLSVKAQEMVEVYLNFPGLLKADEFDDLGLNFSISNESETLTVPAETSESHSTGPSQFSDQIDGWDFIDGKWISNGKPTVA